MYKCTTVKITPRENRTCNILLTSFFHNFHFVKFPIWKLNKIEIKSIWKYTYSNVNLLCLQKLANGILTETWRLPWWYFFFFFLSGHQCRNLISTFWGSASLAWLHLNTCRKSLNHGTLSVSEVFSLVCCAVRSEWMGAAGWLKLWHCSTPQTRAPVCAPPVNQCSSAPHWQIQAWWPGAS